jgi:hypothetical protein
LSVNFINLLLNLRCFVFQFANRTFSLAFPSTMRRDFCGSAFKEALIKSPLRKSDPVSTIEIHLPLKSKSFLRHPSNLKFGQDFQLRLNQRFPKALFSRDTLRQKSTIFSFHQIQGVANFLRLRPDNFL